MMMLPDTLLVFIFFVLSRLVFSLETSINYNQSDNISINFDDERLAKWKTSFDKINSNSNEPFCVCDQTLQSCDIDCCCDRDCSQLDKYAFSRCLLSSSKVEDLCPSTANIFNRKRLGPIQSNRALCVWRDNARQQLLFANKKLITDLSQLSSIKPVHHFKWASNNHSNWIKGPIDSSNGTLYSVKSFLEYKSSNAIIRTLADVTTRALDHWTLPSSMNSLQGECNHMRTVNYISPFRSACTVPLHPLSSICTQTKSLDADTYYRSIRFHYYDNSKDEHLLIGVELASNYSKVQFDSKTGSCLNVVEYVKYTVWHRGLYGIARVLHEMKQTNITYPSLPSLKLSQKFSVDFEWAARQSNYTPSLHGPNLGYLFNRSLIFAERIINESFVAVKKRLISDYRSGACLSSHEITTNVIRFGINQLTQCRLRANLNTTKAQICAELAKHILLYYDQGPSGLYLATLDYISHSSNDSQLWIQVVELPLSPFDWGDNNACGNLSGGGSLQIYYAKVGSREQAQHRIIGAFFRRRPLRGVESQCSAERCRLTVDTDLVYSVDFIDVTEPLRPEFAPAPSIKIELPSDIFYPFQTSSSATPSTIIYSSFAISLLVIFIMGISR